jgi:putative Mn2+ efflux pump MntP
MLSALLDTGVTSIGVDRALLAVQQFGNLSEPRLNVGTNMGLHFEEILITFLRLMHHWIAFTVLVLVELGAWIIVASTMVLWRSERPFSCK